MLLDGGHGARDLSTTFHFNAIRRPLNPYLFEHYKTLFINNFIAPCWAVY
jgi:hypothetical protein